MFKTKNKRKCTCRACCGTSSKAIGVINVMLGIAAFLYAIMSNLDESESLQDISTLQGVLSSDSCHGIPLNCSIDFEDYFEKKLNKISNFQSANLYVLIAGVAFVLSGMTILLASFTADACCSKVGNSETQSFFTSKEDSSSNVNVEERVENSINNITGNGK